MATQKLIDFLISSEDSPFAGKQVKCIETHISYILLVGDFAYKIKKSTTVGDASICDFRTLEQRKWSCERELELNRRYAPDMYLAVLPIYQNGSLYSFEGPGEVVEYAVSMRRFEQSNLLNNLLEDGAVTIADITALVDRLCVFYQNAEAAPKYGTTNQLLDMVEENVETTNALAQKLMPQQQKDINKLLARYNFCFVQVSHHFSDRHKAGLVKSLHGDLHTGNIARIKGELIPFDGLEFNDRLSCTDQVMDIAFLIMDLISRNRMDMANVVLNRYLERTDDFDGLSILPFCLAHRALVRAKVTLLKAEGQQGVEQVQSIKEARRFIKLAENCLARKKPQAVVAFGGLSGSGKSTVASGVTQLWDDLVAHIKSDAVRKHIVGCPLDETAPPEAYADSVSDAVYDGLVKRAAMAVETGFLPFLDATHIKAEGRDTLQNWAKQHALKLVGIWCYVDQATAEKRIRSRKNDVSDANVAIYHMQLDEFDPKKLSWERVNTISSPAKNARKAKSLIEKNLSN